METMSTPVLQMVFFGLVGCTIFIMKSVSFWLYAGKPITGRWLFLVSPLSSLDTWKRSEPLRAGMYGKYSRLLLFYLCLTGSSYWLYWSIAGAAHPSRIALSYLALWPGLFSFLAIGVFAQSIFLPLGRLLPVQNINPAASKSVTEFWGGRWNIWIGDWFKQVIFHPWRRSPAFASFLTFLFSGILHEAVITVPVLVLYGRFLLGPILAYFLLQWVGVMVDRKLVRNYPGLRRIWFWIVVAGPAPLFFVEPMLRILFLWPE